MLRLVFDTDVLVAALRSAAGASRQLLLLALDGQIEMLLSVPLVVEYEAVLTRSEHLTASGLSADEVNAVLDALVAAGKRLPLRFLWRPQLKDPADEMVLETAVNGRADCLITFNMRHLADAASRFGIRTQTPSEILWQIQERRNEKK